MQAESIEQIRRFYERCRQELYTYALSLTCDAAAAEDAVHTAFCGILKRRKAPRDLRPYVFRCIRNAAVDEARRNGRQMPDQSIFPAPQDAPNPERRAQLDEALRGLNDDERECIVLKVYNNMTFKEIAAVRKVSVNTAASWYRRGLEKLKGMLDGGP